MGERDALSAILAGGYLGNDLGGDIAGGGETVGLLDQSSADDGAVLQHVLQVDQITVVHMLGKIIRVMEMDEALLMGVYNIRREQEALGDILADFSSHVIPLYTVDRGILVGIFLLHLFIVALDKAQDLLIRGIGFAHQSAAVAVGDITSGHIEGPLIHDLILYHILNLFHA